jgi:hypothetical protein
MQKSFLERPRQQRKGRKRKGRTEQGSFSNEKNLFRPLYFSFRSKKRPVSAFLKKEKEELCQEKEFQPIFIENPVHKESTRPSQKKGTLVF